MISRFLLVIASGCAALVAQPTSKWASCPVIARLPADTKWTEPLSSRQRFELRGCGDGTVVTAFEGPAAKPSLVFDTGDDYPRFLVHAENVLVLQSTGGASDHVYVFAFRSGKPSLVLKTATKDPIQVRQTEDELVIAVAPPTYPEPDGRMPRAAPAKEYRFARR